MTWRSDTAFSRRKITSFFTFLWKNGVCDSVRSIGKKGYPIHVPVPRTRFLPKNRIYSFDNTLYALFTRDSRSPSIRVRCRQSDRREHVDGGRGDRGQHCATLVSGGRIPAGPGAHELDPAGFHLRQKDVDVADEQQHVVPDHIERNQVRHRLVLLRRQQRHRQRVVSVRVADRGT